MAENGDELCVMMWVVCMGIQVSAHECVQKSQPNHKCAFPSQTIKVGHFLNPNSDSELQLTFTTAFAVLN